MIMWFISKSEIDLRIENDPISFSQAIECDDSNNAIDKELKLMNQNQVQDLVELLKKCKQIAYMGF